jgi:prophage antirepressor-like protein
VAKDILLCLGLENITETLRRIDDEDLSSVKLMSGGQNRKMYIVNEFGLYDLILLSRKKRARVFKKWVTHEVLHAITKTRTYLKAPRFMIDWNGVPMTDTKFWQSHFLTLSFHVESIAFFC